MSNTTSPADGADGADGDIGNMFRAWLARATPEAMVFWGMLLGVVVGTALCTMASAAAAAVAVAAAATRRWGPLGRQMERRGRRGQEVGWC